MAHTPIDDERLNADKPASALLSERSRLNVIENGTDRHSHGAIRYGTEAVPAEAVSTHPDHYWAIPLLVPWESGADTLNVRVVATGHATLDTTWALWVEGQHGATATLAGASKQTITLTCGVPRGRNSRPPGGMMRAAILLRSEADTTASYEEVINSFDEDLINISKASPPPAGVSHYLLWHKEATAKTWTGPDGSDGRYYAGHLDVDGSSTDCYVWPSPNNHWSYGIEGGNSNAWLYPLATALLSGIDWWLSGTATEAGAIKAQTVAGAPMRARAVTGMQGQAAALYRERAHVWTASPTRRLMLHCGSGGVVQPPNVSEQITIGETCGRWRADATGLDVTMLAATRDGSSTVTIDWTLTDVPFGGAYTETGQTEISVPLEPRRRLVANGGVLGWAGLTWTDQVWGGSDLLYHSGPDLDDDASPDIDRYGIVPVSITPDTLPTTGTYCRLTIEATYTKSLHVPAMIVRERVEVE